ncbi:hypothetical protein [Brevundimonas naejangsanensis]|uniref:hypothetical protein n=1 Tax=Brevundimonas naejangsanensis TaxID=588932 RepID=UPI0026F2137E|nr:hypothetical protein [Brevundimonas naejangsanensis]
MMTAAPACNTPCPVAPMVHDAIQLVRQLNRYAEHNCDDLWSRTSARLDELTQAASMLKATSPQGLFFQACVALGELDVLDSLLEGGEASAAEKKARRALEKVALALFSDELSVLADYYLTFAFKDAVAA